MHAAGCLIYTITEWVTTEIIVGLDKTNNELAGEKCQASFSVPIGMAWVNQGKWVGRFRRKISSK